MSRVIRTSIWILIGITLCSVISIGSAKIFSHKIGYINLPTLFDKFSMTTGVQLQYNKVVNHRTMLLDSMKLNQESLERQYQTTPTEIVRAQYEKASRDLYLKEKDFERKNEALLNSYNEQVWSRLNVYIEQFGKQNKFDLVLGINGAGNLMYANENLDLTEELLTYCNNLFKGENEN